MPYRDCPSCGLTLYSAAAYATQDFCPRCNVALYSYPRQASAHLDGRSPVAGSERDAHGGERSRDREPAG